MSFRSLRIGMDLDGVVADYAGTVLRMRDTDYTTEDCTHYDLLPHLSGFANGWEMFGWLEDNHPNLFLKLPAFHDAVEAIRILSRAGHHIVFITARPQRAVNDTLDWLRYHFGTGYEVYVTEDKAGVPACDIYLDDSVGQLQNLVRHHPDAFVVRWPQPWNSHVHGTCHVEGWDDFNSLVNGLANEDPTENEIVDMYEPADSRREFSPLASPIPTPFFQMSPNLEPTEEDIKAHFGESLDSSDSGTGEIRVVNESTGGEKGQKPARFDLIPALPLADVARHYGIGARKYEDRNWERGYAWSLSFGAIQRHLWAFWDGEDLDPDADTTTTHLAAVVFHALALMEFMQTHPELDDRPKR